MATQRKLGTGTKTLNPTVTTTDGAKRQTTTIITGAYADLETLQATYETTAKATTLSPDTAGMGSLSITTESAIESETPPEITPVVKVTLRWQEYERPIEQHPRYATSTADRLLIAKSQVLYPDANIPDPTPAWDTDETHYKLKIAMGITTYQAFRPVVTKSLSHYTGALVGTGIGTVSAPTDVDDTEITVSGYVFMLVADDRDQEGTHQARVKVWIGYPSPIDDLYTWTPLLPP